MSDALTGSAWLDTRFIVLVSNNEMANDELLAPGSAPGKLDAGGNAGSSNGKLPLYTNSSMSSPSMPLSLRTTTLTPDTFHDRPPTASWKKLPGDVES